MTFGGALVAGRGFVAPCASHTGRAVVRVPYRGCHVRGRDQVAGTPLPFLLFYPVAGSVSSTPARRRHSSSTRRPEIAHESPRSIYGTNQEQNKPRYVSPPLSSCHCHTTYRYRLRDRELQGRRRREYGKRPRASSYPLHSSLPSLDPFPSPGYQFRRRGSSIGPRSGLIWGHPSARSDSWAPPTHLGALGFRGRGSVCLLCSDLGGLSRGCRVRDRAVAWGRDGIANSSVGRVDPPNSFGRVNQQPVLTPITPRALCDCWRGSVHVCRLSTNAECRGVFFVTDYFKAPC
jgi:hypothetical protein